MVNGWYSCHCVCYYQRQMCHFVCNEHILYPENPDIWTRATPGFGIEKNGRDPGIRTPGLQS